MFVGIVLILFGALALVDAFLPAWARRRALPVAGVHRRDRGPPRGDRRATRTDRIVIGGAVLIVGLLLILAGLAAGPDPRRGDVRLVGDSPGPGAGLAWRAAARSAPSCSRRSIRPRGTRTRRSASGSVIGVFAFAALFSLASAGLATLLAGIGVVLIALTIEGSRLVARVERRRATLGEPGAPPGRIPTGRSVAASSRSCAPSSPTRTAGGTCSTSAVNFPLAIIEFVVVAVVWACSLSLLTMPLWYDAVAGGEPPAVPRPFAGHDAPIVLLRTLAGLALLPVAASLSQLVMALHRAVVAGLLCTSESRELRRQVETLKESRSASSTSRRASCTGSSATSTTAPSSAWSCSPSTSASRASGSTPIPRRRSELVLEGQEQARQALAELRDLVRGIAPVDPARPRARAGARLDHRARARADRRPERPAGRRATAGRRSSGRPTSSSPRRSRTSPSTAARRALRGPLPPGGLDAWSSRSGTTAPAAPRSNRAAGWRGSRDASPASTARFTVSSPAGGPTLVRAELPVASWAPPTTGWVLPKS